MMALVTGGASSGKSAYAEELCVEQGGNLVYLAAMRPFGEEGARRVRKHRAQRAGKGFLTIECYEDFSAVADDGRIDGATVLLESLGNVVANEMFKETEAVDGDAERVAGRIAGIVEKLAQRAAHLVVVGDEVGGDGAGYPFETHAYRQALGSASCRIASMSDRVVECVAGMPAALKVE